MAYHIRKTAALTFYAFIACAVCGCGPDTPPVKLPNQGAKITLIYNEAECGNRGSPQADVAGTVISFIATEFAKWFVGLVTSEVNDAIAKYTSSYAVRSDPLQFYSSNNSFLPKLRCFKLTNDENNLLFLGRVIYSDPKPDNSNPPFIKIKPEALYFKKGTYQNAKDDDKDIQISIRLQLIGYWMEGFRGQTGILFDEIIVSEKINPASSIDCNVHESKRNAAGKIYEMCRDAAAKITPLPPASFVHGVGGLQQADSRLEFAVNASEVGPVPDILKKAAALLNNDDNRKQLEKSFADALEKKLGVSSSDGT